VLVGWSVEIMGMCGLVGLFHLSVWICPHGGECPV
jgi:hypothetical protein